MTVLANALGLMNIQPLIPTKREEYSKIAIYVPSTHVEDVRQVMGDAGIGQIGAYSHCTFTTSGTGSFQPLAVVNRLSDKLVKLNTWMK